MIRTGVDFQKVERQRPLDLGLLVIGILALALATWTQQRWEAKASDQALLRQREDDAARRQQEQVRPVEPTPSERRMQAAQSDLRRPWLATLRMIEEATQNPIYLRSLAIEPLSGLVKLEAEAPSFDHALAYVQVLDAGGVLGPASIASHEEIPDPAMGLTTVRFDAIAKWRTR